MAKGKKKGNGKKRGGKKIRDRDDKGDGASPDDVEDDTYIEITPEHMERARLAAANRTEDPLKNWTRPMQEECPICMIPMPLNFSEHKFCVTCDKTVCWGCMLSTGLAHGRDGGDEQTAIEKAFTCPFCRSDTRVTGKSLLEKEMKRVNAGNGEAMYRVGNYYFKGQMTLRQDKAEGLKWYHRALEAGSGLAAYIIGTLYHEGDGVHKDIDKELEYFQKAADLGYIPARFLIGDLLMNIGEIEEALLNYRKAAMCGMTEDRLFNILRNGFRDGFITKEEYAFTLRENQNAYNEMKSDEREWWKTVL